MNGADGVLVVGIVAEGHRFAEGSAQKKIPQDALGVRIKRNDTVISSHAKVSQVNIFDNLALLLNQKSARILSCFKIEFSD